MLPIVYFQTKDLPGDKSGSQEKHNLFILCPVIKRDGFSILRPKKYNSHTLSQEKKL